MINTLKLYPNKPYDLFLSICCGTCALIIIWLFSTGRITFGFFTFIFFVGFTLTTFFTTANIIFRHKIYLQVDADGVTVNTLFNTSYVQWAKVKGFVMVPEMGEVSQHLRIILLDDAATSFDRTKKSGALLPKSSLYNMEKSIPINSCYGKSSLAELAMFLDAQLQLYRQADEG